MTTEERFAANRGLIRLITEKFTWVRGVDRDDLEADCSIALWRACQLFDPARGYQFSTYACRSIRNAAMKYVAREAKHRNGHHVPVADPADRGRSPTAVADDRLDLDCMLNTLQERDADILRARARGQTLRDIGRRLNLTGEAVRQASECALGTLQRRFARGIRQ